VTLKEVLASKNYENLIRNMYEVHIFHQNDQEAPDKLYDDSIDLYDIVENSLDVEDSNIFGTINNLASSSFCFSRSKSLPVVNEISPEFCEFLLNIDNLTPIDALTQLKQISKKLPRSVSLENRARQFLRLGDKVTHDILMKEANRPYPDPTDAK